MQPNLDALREGLTAFVLSLQEQNPRPVHIALDVFSGGDETDPDNVIHRTRWQNHTLDTQQLLSRISELDQYVGPQPEQASLNGALIESLTQLESTAVEISQRNKGGALPSLNLVMITDSVDSSGLVTPAEAQTAVVAQTGTVMALAISNGMFSETNLQALTTDWGLAGQTSTEITRELATLAARIKSRARADYLIAYCTPSRNGQAMTELTVNDAVVTKTASFNFDATGLVGCQPEDSLDTLCQDKECGGLGCGACDDRGFGCNAAGQCQDYCETDSVGVDVPIADRCDAENPAGYPQYCAQAISTLCDEACRDLTVDPQNCGGCGVDCGLNVVGNANDVPTPGQSCAAGVCQCAPGWHGERCDETRCGDGVKTDDEECDDGNESNGDQCGNTCVSLSTATCIHPCDFDGTYTLDPSPVPLDPALDDGHPDDFFGYSVAIFGNTTIVGAHEDDANGIGSGAAYIFSKSNGRWSQVAKVLARDGLPGDKLGWSVGLTHDAAIIGARSRADNGSRSGAAYIVTSTDGTWSEPLKILPLDGAANDEFGWSVSVSGDVAVVGAPGDGDLGARSGSVYVFRRTDGQWQQSAKLIPQDGAASDYFGYSVSVSNDIIVVGAHGDDDGGDLSGAVYVFEWDGMAWQETAKLLADDGAIGDWFGYSVSISGQTIAIGARNHDAQGPDSGAAYLFEQGDDGTWSQATKLTAGADSSLFGNSVAISGGTALIGTGVNGPAYLYQKVGDDWSALTTLAPAEGARAFSRAVSLSGEAALIGAYLVNWPAPRCTVDGACYCKEGPLP